jgi:hypothetical protein
MSDDRSSDSVILQRDTLVGGGRCRNLLSSDRQQEPDLSAWRLAALNAARKQDDQRQPRRSVPLYCRGEQRGLIADGMEQLNA